MIVPGKYDDEICPNYFLEMENRFFDQFDKLDDAKLFIKHINSL